MELESSQSSLIHILSKTAVTRPIFPILYLVIFTQPFLCSYPCWIASIHFRQSSTLSKSFWILILFSKVLTTPPSLASSANLMKLIKLKLNERLPLTSRSIGVSPNCLTSLRSDEIHLLLYKAFLLGEKTDAYWIIQGHHCWLRET